MLHRTLLTSLLAALALAPAALAAPRAHSAAQVRAEAALDEAEDLLDGQGVRTGRELTEALRQLRLREDDLRGRPAARAAAILSRPIDGPPQLCSAHFCVTGTPAGIVTRALILTEAEAVWNAEVGGLGWSPPPDDGDGRVDIYLDDLGAESLFGYAETDGGNDTSQSSFLVLDDDYDPLQFGGTPALESLRVTLVHEFGHVLQYGYDVTADGWHYESSAVWLEQRVYPEIEDWLRFVNDRTSGAGWRSLTELPLTAFDHPDDQPRNAKPYGSVVFHQFLSSKYGATGDRLQRASWEQSSGLDRPSTAAFDRAIVANGGQSVSSDFSAFAAAVSEWRAPAAPFTSPGSLPDVERRGTLTTDGAGVSPAMDHLTFALYDVPETDAAQIRLAGVLPAGASGALALVARTGGIASGQVTTRLLELPDGGAGGVTLENPASYLSSGGRITAVLVNSDADQRGYDNRAADWVWARDAQRFSARLSSSADGPKLSARTPGPGARRVSTRSQLSITFSEAVAGVDENTFVLRDARGRKVPAAVTYVSATRTATLIPERELADTTRYTVRVGGSILSSTAVPISQTDWEFTTVRLKPRAALELRGGTLRLRSRDRDRLRWVAVLSQGGREVGRRSGKVKAGATRKLRVGSGRPGRARVVVTVTDPQGNRRKLQRAIRLLP